jgi:hypothetical protein
MKLICSGMRLFLFLATLVMCSSISAQETPGGTVITYQSGEQLTNRCRAYLRFRRHDPVTQEEEQQVLYDSGVCLGYVMGVVDLVRAEHEQAFATNKVAPICLPQGIIGETLTDMVARYLDQYPAPFRHLPGGEVVIAVLAKTSPCNQ